METPRKSFPWLRFTLRESLLLVVSVALALGWLRDFMVTIPIRHAVSSVLAPNSLAKERSVTTFGTFGGVKFIVTAGSDDWWETYPPPGLRDGEDAWK